LRCKHGSSVRKDLALQPGGRLRGGINNAEWRKVCFRSTALNTQGKESV
jgi:hypothetical protein